MNLNPLFKSLKHMVIFSECWKSAKQFDMILQETWGKMGIELEKIDRDKNC